jgi:hypothetical protein
MRRWRVGLVVGLLALLGGAVFVLPPVYWRLAGWARGEAFYEGRPTSYWSREVRERYGFMARPDVQWPLARQWVARSEPPALDQWLGELGLCAPPLVGYGTPYIQSDPAAINVLLELLADADPNVRQFACRGIGGVGVEAPAVRPALLEALNDTDSEVRDEAAYALMQIDWGRARGHAE